MEQADQYTVAAFCTTYNQVGFINDALRGFALQQTDFPIVTIVVDDASVDGTAQLLRNWAAENLLLEERDHAYCCDKPYGHLIFGRHKDHHNNDFVILLLFENHHTIKKPKLVYFTQWIENAKYYAICEGDDYWIDPNKLQRQVDYMEENPDVGLLYTDVDRLLQVEDKLEKGIFAKTTGIKNNHADFVMKGWFLAPCTWLLRQSLFEGIPKLDENKYFTGDTLTLLSYSQRSRVGFIGQVTAVYRVLPHSASHFDSFEPYRRAWRKSKNTRIFFAKSLPVLFRLGLWGRLIWEGRVSLKYPRYFVEWLHEGVGDFVELFLVNNKR